MTVSAGQRSRRRRALALRRSDARAAAARAGRGVVDLSHRGVVTVTGPDRLSWLHSLTTQHLERSGAAARGDQRWCCRRTAISSTSLYGVDDGETFWAHTEPGAPDPLVAWLDRMRFLMRVEVADRSEAYAVVWTGRGLRRRRDTWPGRGRTRSAGGSSSCRGTQLAAVLAGAPPAGMWALRGPADRRRRAADRPGHRPPHHPERDRPARASPSTWTRAATAARRPLPGCTPWAGRRAGWCGCIWTAAPTPCPSRARAGAGRPRRRLCRRLGPALRARARSPSAWSSATSPVDAELVVGGIAASQEALVDPEVGLHVRPPL